MSERIYYITYLTFGTLAFAALAWYYPELVAPVFASVVFLIAAGVVMVGVAHAIQEEPAPWPEAGWYGEEVEVAEVYPSDFASREEYEEFRRTSKYVKGHTTENGVDFGAVDEEKVREYLERVEKEKKKKVKLEITKI